MRSRRSGVKKLELVKANISILSKLTALFAIILLFHYYLSHKYQVGDKLGGSNSSQTTTINTKCSTINTTTK